MRPRARYRSERILRACDALLARGRRPTTESVMAWLFRRYGMGVSRRDLSPVLRAWKQRHHCAAAVGRLEAAYRALNPEQQAGFRERIGVMPRPRR